MSHYIKSKQRQLRGSEVQARLALLENLLRCSVTVGLGPIAWPVARFTDNGQYRRCCSSQMTTVKGSC